MQGKALQSEVFQLLEELEGRVLSDSALLGEWKRAMERFAVGFGESGLLRFREWFLLERPSERLGVPPALAWAPDSLEEGSAWQRLLDSFLGIFRMAARQPEEGLLLEDLWSGRAVLLDAGAGAAFTPETLFVGRFVLGEGGLHHPLPGYFVVAAPGLVEALERDLNAQRVENPRARLSQAECERLFAPFLGADTLEAAPLEHLEHRLATLLHGVEGWDLERVRAELQRGGAGELLNRLAFETDVDLEQLRRLLPRFAEAAAGATGQALAAQPAPLLQPRTDSVGAALDRFDRSRRKGAALADSFRQLEHDLGLEEGASLERVTEDPLGPTEAPGYGLWLETFRWEREQGGHRVGAAEERTVREFLAFLESSQPKRIEIHQLAGGHVLGFFLAAEDPTHADRRIAELVPFLRWAHAEQEAPLETLLQSLEEDLAQRLPQVVALNHVLHDVTIHSRAELRQIAPLRVAAADQELAEVEGIPEEFAGIPRVGDTLLGEWKGGRFRVAALWPRLPAPHQIESPDA